MHVAAQIGRPDIVQYFLDRGVSKHVTRSNGWTLLHCAAASGDLRTVEFMVEKLELDVNQIDGEGEF